MMPLTILFALCPLHLPLDLTVEKKSWVLVYESKDRYYFKATTEGKEIIKAVSMFNSIIKER